jgi:putative membrane protein
VSIFGIVFWIVDALTPYRLWQEMVEQRNVALASVVGAVAISIAIIVSSAIH